MVKPEKANMLQSSSFLPTPFFLHSYSPTHKQTNKQTKAHTHSLRSLEAKISESSPKFQNPESNCHWNTPNQLTLSWQCIPHLLCPKSPWELLWGLLFCFHSYFFKFPLPEERDGDKGRSKKNLKEETIYMVTTLLCHMLCLGLAGWQLQMEMAISATSRYSFINSTERDRNWGRGEGRAMELELGTGMECQLHSPFFPCDYTQCIGTQIVGFVYFICV